MLQQLLTRTDNYDVIATMNLNGDYMSDAAGARLAASASHPAPTSATAACSPNPSTAPHPNTKARTRSTRPR